MDSSSTFPLLSTHLQCPSADASQVGLSGVGNEPSLSARLTAPAVGGAANFSANSATPGMLVASPLGTIAKFVTPPPFGGRGEAAVRRFMLQSAARELVPGERVAKCLRVPAGTGVDVFYAPAARAAHYGGLQTCGSIWMCPVCAAKISERRRVELQAALAGYDGVVALATFTVQHRASDRLSTLLDGFLTSLRRLRMGSPWIKIESRFGIVGVVRAVEITHGANGWHPHAHMLFFLPPGADTLAMWLLESALRRRWLGVLARAGLSASWSVGVDVRAADDAAGDYVAKFGSDWTAAHELTKAVVKQGRGSESRTIAQLLADFAVVGDRQAGELWREYALLFRGKKHLVWSRGLRDRLLPDVAEKTDEELANEHDQVAVLLATLTLRQWSVVVANDARAELLTVAASGDVVHLLDFLVALGVEIGGVVTQD